MRSEVLEGRVGEEASPVLVALLGEVRLTPPGRDPVGLRGARAQVCLAVLAYEAGEVVSRHRLAEAIWGEELPASWRSALRTVVVAVRKALGAAGLDGVRLLLRGDGYRLDVSPGSVDVWALERRAAAAEAAFGAGDHVGVLAGCVEALAGSSSTALSGVEGAFADAVRARVDRLRAAVRSWGCQAALQAGAYAAAEELADQMVAADPLREEGHRLLMRARQAAGNRAEALRAYERCRVVLSEELGVGPSADTEAVFADILAHEPAPAAGGRRMTGAAARLLAVHRHSPYVGRSEVLDRLGRLLEEALAGGPVVAAVSGEAGAGKTRLAAEVAARADGLGMSVLYGRADDRIRVPAGCLVEAVSGYLAGFGPAEISALLGDHAAVLAGLLPSLAAVVLPAAPLGFPDLDQLQLSRAFEHALRVASGTSGALVVLDDMQWATRPAAAALEHLAARAAAMPLLVLVLTRHPASLPPGASASFELEPLGVGEVGALLEAAEVAGVSAEAVWRGSGGNALLVAEQLRSLAGGTQQRAPSATLEEIVRARLAALTAEAGRLVQAAAVAGEVFEPAVVAAAVGLGAARAAFGEAVRAALLEPAVAPSGWMAFRHDLIRTAVLATIPTDRRVRLHAQLGAALEVAGDLSPVPLAYHFGAAAPLGDWRRVLRYALPVARAGLAAGVYEDVVAVATRTLDALEGAGDPDPGGRLDLQVLLGAALRALGDPAGHRVLREAFARAQVLGDAERMADAALAFTDGGAAGEEAAVDDGLVDLYRAALAALPAEQIARRARLLGHLATGLVWRLDGIAARAAAAEAVALARQTADPAVLLPVLTTVRRTMSVSLDPAGAERLEGDLVELSERLDDPAGRALGALWRFETRVQQGRGQELEGLVEEIARHAAVLRPGSYHHSLAYTRAALALLRGDLDGADALREEAAAVGRAHGLDAEVVEAVRLTQLMAVRAEQGRLGEVRPELVGFFGQGPPQWKGVVAVVDALCGTLDQVEANLGAFFDALGDHDATLVGTVGMTAWMAAPIARTGNRAQARRLHDRLVPFSGLGTYVALFTGPIDYWLGVLADTLGRTAEAACRYRAAAGFCSALGAPRWAARCQSALAEVDARPSPPALTTTRSRPGAHREFE